MCRSHQSWSGVTQRLILSGCLIALICSCVSCTASTPVVVRTTLTDEAIEYSVPDKPYVVLKRGDVTMVIADNRPVDDQILPGHRGGYSGVASLTHSRRKSNLFVPAYAGLNFEHIHDGTIQDRKILFEPRNAPMQLRVINEHTVELYQAPTPHWKLESSSRYELLADGTIQMTFQCIPRARAFANGYIGLFWASYIHHPQSLDIHFKGLTGREMLWHRRPHWVRGGTPAHGTASTHRPLWDNRRLEFDKQFPLTLVFNHSKHRYAEPWYIGVSHGMGFAQIFRATDEIRFSQSPSGGGKGNPAWDFQFLIPNYEVGKVYGFVMRAAYLPYNSMEQMEKAAVLQHRQLEPEK